MQFFRYNEDEKIQMKIEFLRMVLKMELNPAQKHFITGFFEQYHKLNDKEEVAFMKEMRDMENRDLFTKLPVSWEERGIEKGKAEIVREMLKSGASVEYLVKMTHLNKKEIERLMDT